MKNLFTFEAFNEAKAKPGPDTYHRGLSDDDIEDKEDQIKKQADMDDDDPDAYKEMPGDKEAREKGEVRKSKHTKSYDELYGDEKNESILTEASKIACLECDEVNTAKAWAKNNDVCPSCNDSTNGVSEAELYGDDIDEAKVETERYYRSHMKKPKGFGKWLFSYNRDGSDMFEIPSAMNWSDAQKWAKKKAKEDGEDYVYVMESTINEEKLDASAEKGLKNKSDDTGVPIGILRDVYRRGMAAWKSGHRPGAGQQQWAYARVNSFLTKQPGTWGGADKDLAKKVRDGGHDKKLKKG